MDDRREDERADADIVERVAPLLREPVRVSAAYEQNVMAGVRSIATGELPVAPAPRAAEHVPAAAWWRRSRTIRFSPLAGLAAAAGFAGIVSLATLKVVGGAPAPAMGDTVHLVRFVYVDRNASQVAMVGDFNGWDGTATPLTPTGVEGVWSVAVPMRRGRHEYAFIADGKRWTADPLVPARADDHGTESSIVNVGVDTR